MGPPRQLVRPACFKVMVPLLILFPAAVLAGQTCLLDDLSLAKYGYVLDMNAIKLRDMQGEWLRRHTPKRPVEKYAMYMGLTCTGGIIANQLNSSGVYAIL